MSRRIIRGRILPLEILKNITTDREWVVSQGFGSESRRREWLSWRVALRESLREEPFCGVGGEELEIAYSDIGAPYIVGSPHIYIGVSHAKDRVLVVLSHHRCGVDIEFLGRDFASVRSRYISQAESQIIEGVEYGEALAWCVKEAAYKYSGQRGLDFLRDIEIVEINAHSKEVKVRIFDKFARAIYFIDNEHVEVVI